MWRRVVPLALLVCAVFASSAAAKARVSVAPSTGKPTTSFVIRFRAPNATGNSSTVHSHYQLTVSGNRGKRCTRGASVAMGPTRRGQRVRVALRPKGSGRVWCVGGFHGTITQISRVVCNPINQIVCPEIEIAPVTVAHFSFRVRKASKTSTGPTTSGPTFAGLQSAATCIPVTPKILPAVRTVELTWNAATDPSTPRSKIVYDIYYSQTSGGENYAAPSWTTAPGASGYTVDLTGLGPAYFVVRARDQAGRQDHNTVQRLAVNTCLVPLGTVRG